MNKPTIRVAQDHRSCNCCCNANYDSMCHRSSGAKVPVIYEICIGTMVSAVCPDCLRSLMEDAKTELSNIPSQSLSDSTRALLNVFKVVRLVEDALKKHTEGAISVDLNEETGCLDINHCSRNNSYAVCQTDIPLENIRKDALYKELDKLRVGYCF